MRRRDITTRSTADSHPLTAVFYIRNNVFGLPEVKTFLSENKIHFSDARPAYVMNFNRKLPVGMNFSNLTLRELLNKITKVKRGGWYLRKSVVDDSDEEEYIEIDI